MYTDIGLRNHRASQKQGIKAFDKMKENENLKSIADRYRELLYQLDTLYDAANMIVNG